MLIFPNKSRYGVAPISPYFQSLFITFFFPAYFHSEFIFLSTSRTEWKKNWWVRTGCESIDQHHAYAYRLSLSFLVFRHLSLSLFLLSPFPSGNFDISFLVPTRGNVDYVFNGVPLVWWEISFKAWRLAYSANLSKFEEFVENVLSKGCCTNFYLSANWKINFWWISFFF